MFRETMGPSSGDTTVFLRQLVLVILCRWLAGMQEHMLLHTSQSSTQNNKYQLSQKHSCISWWWAHSLPKHVEIDRYKYEYSNNKLCTTLVLFTRRGVRFLCSDYDIGLADETKQVPPPPFPLMYRVTPSTNSAIFLQAKRKISHYIQHIYIYPACDATARRRPWPGSHTICHRR